MPTRRSPRLRGAYVIDEARAIRLLASPLRQAMIDGFIANGPMSVSELSRLMRRAPDRLYYHVRLLERAKLLVATGGQAANGRSETRYEVPGRPMYLRYDPSSTSNRRAVGRVVNAMLRAAKRDFTHAFAERDVEVDGPRRNLWAARVQGHLAKDEVAEVNALLRRLLELIGRADHASVGGRLHQLTWVYSPSELK